MDCGDSTTVAADPPPDVPAPTNMCSIHAMRLGASLALSASLAVSVSTTPLAILQLFRVLEGCKSSARA